MCETKMLTIIDDQAVWEDDAFLGDAILRDAAINDRDSDLSHYRMGPGQTAALASCPPFEKVMARFNKEGWDEYRSIQRGGVITPIIRSERHRVVFLHRDPNQTGCTFRCVQDRTHYLSGQLSLRVRWLQFHIDVSDKDDMLLEKWFGHELARTAAGNPGESDSDSHHHGPWTIDSLRTSAFKPETAGALLGALQIAANRDERSEYYDRFKRELNSPSERSVFRYDQNHDNELLDWDEYLCIDRAQRTMHVIQIIEHGVRSDRAFHWLQLGEDGIKRWNRARVVAPEEVQSSLLRCIRLHGADLRGADFSQMRFCPDDFERYGEALGQKGLEWVLDSHGANFSSCDLRETSFRDADASMTDFEGADLRNADLSGGRFCWSNFYKADLRGADLRDSDLSGAVMRYADFRDARLDGARLPLHMLAMRGAIFDGADLRNCVMTGADFREASLDGAVFPSTVDQARFGAACAEWESEQHRTSPHGAVFKDATLRDCEFEDINAAIDLEDAKLIDCKMSGALAGSNLCGADFENTLLPADTADGCLRRITDRPLSHAEQLETVILFLSPAALAALSITCVQSLGTSYNQAVAVSIGLAFVYSLYLVPSIVRFIRKTGPRPHVPHGILGIVCIDSFLTLFQAIFDQSMTYSTLVYVIVVWISAIVSSLLISLVAVGVPKKRWPRFVHGLRAFVRTLVWFPLVYTAVYGFRESGAALGVAAYLTFAAILFDFKRWFAGYRFLAAKLFGRDAQDAEETEAETKIKAN